MAITIKGIAVTPAQKEVYDALRPKPLPDHVLVPIVQHMGELHQTSSGIRTRRLELQRKGLVNQAGKTVRTGHGRRALVFKAVK